MAATQYTRQSGHTEERACPDWCYECLHDVGPEAAFWHKGEPITIDVYGECEGSNPVPLVVQAEYLDELPDDRDCGRDALDLEPPRPTGSRGGCGRAEHDLHACPPARGCANC